MENKFKNTELEGINIYHDKKGQKVYLDPITKNGYIIPQNKEKAFKTSSNVALYTGLVGIFAYALFDFSILVTIIAMVVVFAVLEYRFRKFLNSCTMIANFKPAKRNESQVYSSPDSIIIIKIVLYFVIAALLIATLVLGETNNPTVYAGSIAMALVAAFIGGKYVTILYARKKH